MGKGKKTRESMANFQDSENSGSLRTDTFHYIFIQIHRPPRVSYKMNHRLWVIMIS